VKHGVSETGVASEEVFNLLQLEDWRQRVLACKPSWTDSWAPFGQHEFRS
jgi:hypothetical protein